MIQNHNFQLFAKIGWERQFPKKIAKDDLEQQFADCTRKMFRTDKLQKVTFTWFVIY